MSFGEALRRLIAERKIGVRELARRVPCDAGHLSKISYGVKRPSERLAARLDELLDAGGELLALYRTTLDNKGQATSVDCDKAHSRYPDEDDDEMQRRRLLQSLITLGATSSPAVEALQHIRDGVDRAIGRDEDSHLDEWEETVAEYGYSILRLPPHRTIPNLAADLVAVQQVASRHAGGRQHPAWCRVASGLSTLMAKTLCSVGQLRLARDWWNTAERAAVASGDADLSVWVTAERLVEGMYEQRPVAVMLRRADATLASAPRAPGPGVGKLYTARAQLFALQGDGAAATAALRTAEECLQQLPASVTGKGPSVFGWGEDRVRYTEAWVHAHVGGGIGELEEAVERALHALPDGEPPRRPAQLRLLHAAGLVRAGDTTEGIRQAHALYEAQPAEQRSTMVTSLAHQVMESVPAPRRAEPAVAAYRELLASAPRRSIT
jgi:transcriptional regulator with XRE-family HTH domain